MIGNMEYKNMIKLLYRKIMKILANKAPVIHTKILYYRSFGQKLDLNNPLTLNEKLLWLKLYEYPTKPIYSLCADKYRVREYIESKGMKEILNTLYGVYNNANDINFSALPNKFAMKCNHGSGYNIICDNKDSLDINKTKAKLDKWLGEDFSEYFSELHYKNIERKIICEEFIQNKEGEFPDDYKFYCFGGKPKVVMLCRGRKDEGGLKFYYFDLEWNILPLSTDSIIAIQNNITFDKPKGFDQLAMYANKLCEDFKFVRVDLYLRDGTVLFGELTFCPGAGLDVDRLHETDIFLGNELNLT